MPIIHKAVLSVAGRKQRSLALQSLVDRDAEPKSALRILLEEALDAGVEEVALIVCPGDEEAYRAAAGPLSARLVFIQQREPLGYGHALLCARNWAGSLPFLHMVGDHLYVSRDSVRCARQLVTIADTEACAVSAVQSTRERLLPYYGTVGGRRVPGAAGLYQIDEVIEKPTPTEAERKLVVPGLRAGHYLCFFGMHVLTTAIFDILDSQIQALERGSPIALSPALASLSGKERYLAAELNGSRYDMGEKYGLWIAQLALGMSGRDREELLLRIVEMVANRG